MGLIYTLFICAQIQGGGWNCIPADARYPAMDEQYCKAVAKQANVALGPDMRYVCAYRQGLWQIAPQ